MKYTNIHVMCPQVLQHAHRSDATPADVKHRHQPPSAPSSSPPPPTPCPRCSSPAGSIYTHTSISWMPGVGGGAAAEDVAEQARNHGAIGTLLSPCEGAASPPLGAVAGGGLSLTGMHACMHEYTRHRYMHACIHACMHAHTHTHIHIHTNIHTSGAVAGGALSQTGGGQISQGQTSGGEAGRAQAPDGLGASVLDTAAMVNLLHAIFLPVSMYLCLSLSLSVCLSILSIYLSMYLSIYLRCVVLIHACPQSAELECGIRTTHHR